MIKEAEVVLSPQAEEVFKYLIKESKNPKLKNLF